MSEEGIVAVRMPKWGMAMEEGTLVAWLAKEGDRVNSGDIIAEVESTKVTGEIEARASGVLRRQIAAVGDILPVGALLAVLSDTGVRDDAIDSFVASNAVAAQTAAIETKSSARSITVDGREIIYTTSGTGGIPAVLIHGLGGSKDAWALTEPELAQQRLVVALDLPGHGDSSKNVGSGSIGIMSGVVSALGSTLGFERAHYVGHSFGGAAALAFAEACPNKVASLSLIASAGLGPEINGAYLSAFAAATRMRDLKKAATLLFADPSFVHNAFLEELARYKTTDGVTSCLQQIIAACFPCGAQSPDLQRRTIAERLPSQILWGSEDRIIPAAHASGMNNATILPGAGHMVHVEQSRKVNILLTKLMADTDAAAGAAR